MVIVDTDVSYRRGRTCGSAGLPVYAVIYVLISRPIDEILSCDSGIELINTAGKIVLGCSEK